jgi:hypothetical protein
MDVEVEKAMDVIGEINLFNIVMNKSRDISV